MKLNANGILTGWQMACLRQSWQNLAQSVFSPPILLRHRHAMLPAFLFLEKKAMMAIMMMMKSQVTEVAAIMTAIMKLKVAEMKKSTISAGVAMKMNDDEEAHNVQYQQGWQ